MVRVFMAIGTGREFNVFVLYNRLGVFSPGTMTLIAGQLLVQTGQRIARLLVIETSGGFPTFERVAAPAIQP